jgi:hypothetical protein
MGSNNITSDWNDYEPGVPESAGTSSDLDEHSLCRAGNGVGCYFLDKRLNVTGAHLDLSGSFDGEEAGIGAGGTRGGMGGRSTKGFRAWASKLRGGGKYDCVAATCGRSIRAGQVVNVDEVLANANLNQGIVNVTRGVSIPVAREIFQANGKILGEPVKTPNSVGDYAIVFLRSTGQHMVYGRVTARHGFYIDDAQVGRRYEGQAAADYLNAQLGVTYYPINDQ